MHVHVSAAQGKKCSDIRKIINRKYPISFRDSIANKASVKYLADFKVLNEIKLYNTCRKLFIFQQRNALHSNMTEPTEN